MRLKNYQRFRIAALLASQLLLASCGAAAPLSGAAAGVPALPRDAAAYAPAAPRFAYIGDQYANFVDVFDAQGNLIEKLTAGISAPEGMVVDRWHQLWVANATGHNVLVFPQRGRTAARILDAQGGYPYDVAVSADGTAYVANANDASSADGSIWIFKPGATEPYRQLQDPQMFQNRGVTVDPAGNVYAVTVVHVVNQQYVGRVEMYAKGQESGLRRFPIKLSNPGSIRYANGFLYVCDSNFHTVTEYTTGGRATGRRLVTGGPWQYFGFSPDGSTVLGGDQVYNVGETRTFPGNILVRSFPDPAFQSPSGVAFARYAKGL